MARELRGANALAYRATDRRVLIEGRAGTGKSIGWATKAHHTALQYPTSRQLVLRAYRANLTESFIPTFENKVLRDGHPLIGGLKAENRHSYEYDNGSRIVLAGLDQPGKTFSTEWDRIYVNEATEVPEEAIELLNRAMRNFKTPYHQIMMDCNPREPTHYLNEQATPCDDRIRDISTRESYRRLQAFNENSAKEGYIRRLVGCHQDNPFYFDFRTWDWTREGKEYIDGLRMMRGPNLQRMFGGRWVARSGVVFPEFDEHRHMVDPFKVPADWPIYVFIDPGYDHPCAILWIAIGYDGTHYVIDELYRSGLGVAQHAKDIHERNKGRTVRGYYGDPQYAFSSTMHADNGESIADQFGKHGINLFPWPRTGTDEKAMVENVRTKLESQAIKVFKPCINTKKEFLSWSYRRGKDGQPLPGPEAFEDRDNHAMDCIKGAVACHLQPMTGKIEVYGGEEAPPDPYEWHDRPSE